MCVCASATKPFFAQPVLCLNRAIESSTELRFLYDILHFPKHIQSTNAHRMCNIFVLHTSIHPCNNKNKTNEQFQSRSHEKYVCVCKQNMCCLCYTEFVEQIAFIFSSSAIYSCLFIVFSVHTSSQTTSQHIIIHIIIIYYMKCVYWLGAAVNSVYLFFLWMV